MDSIQAVREAIENLSTDEKIDEGQYLALMNHLKSVYEKIERSERKEEVLPEGVADIIMEELGNSMRSSRILEEERDLNNQLRQMFQNVCFGRMVDDTDRPKVSMLCEAIKHSCETGANVFIQLTKDDLPSFFIQRMLKRGASVWKNLEEREIFLTHPYVREMNIDKAIYGKAMVSVWRNVYDNDGFTDEGLTKVLDYMRLPFFTSKRIGRKGNISEIDEKSLEKLHPITIKFSVPNHPETTISLYTNRIQLGRSNIVDSLYELLLIHIINNRWNDVSLVKIIDETDYGLILGRCEKDTTYPKMIVSGITARTRAKQRAYTCGIGWITLTYGTKYMGK